MTRLSAASRVGPAVKLPGYDPEAHGSGIVHIGVGAFHKAHQAVYTDSALAAAGGDWRITGVSLRSAGVASALNPQDGRYTLIIRDEAGDSARLVGSIARVLVAPADPGTIIEAIADPATKIVTLTVTEKAYGIDRSTGGLDFQHAAIAHDLANRDRPTGVIGFIVAGLSLRMARGLDGLTILCCDNLPENGRITKRLVGEFAASCDEALAAWIENEVRFPSSMVDRITPASTARTFEDAQRLSGCADEAAVETEPFTQWVIEDDFRSGRPVWEAAGALFVDNVAPYEQMKLRLLNGTHSLLAYAGFLAGHETISEAVRDPGLRALAERQMAAAAATLPPVPGIDLPDYCAQLLSRFANRSIRHLTYQVAMDGTEKLPQRILAPLAETLEAKGDGTPFSFAIAAWMRYCMGVTDQGTRYDLRDPREERIVALVREAGRDPGRIYDALSGVFGSVSIGDEAVRDSVIRLLGSMIEQDMKGAIAQANRAGRQS